MTLLLEAPLVFTLVIHTGSKKIFRLVRPCNLPADARHIVTFTFWARQDRLACELLTQFVVGLERLLLQQFSRQRFELAIVTLTKIFPTFRL